MGRCLGWTIPTFTEKMDEAKAFVNYMTAPEQAVTLAQVRSNFITPRASVLEAMADNPSVQLQGMYSEAGVVTNRPFHTRVTRRKPSSDTVFNGYLAGQFDIDEAIANGQRDIEALGE